MEVFKERLKGIPLKLRYYLGVDSDPQSPEYVPDEALTVEGMTIFQAAEKGQIRHVGLFLMGGIDPNIKCDDCTPLHYAAKSGDVATIRILIDNGAEVDARNSKGQTPLMIAAFHGRCDASVVLVEHGASLTAVDNEEQGIAFYAIQSPVVLHCLRKRGLEIPSPAPGNETLYHTAAKMKDARIPLLYLIENTDLDMNQPDADGRTALHYVAMNNDVDAVKTLVSKGAALNAMDSTGHTPFTHPKCKRFIRAWLTKYLATTSNTAKAKLAQPDYSMWREIDRKQIMRTAAAFFFPNLLLYIGSFYGAQVAVLSIAAWLGMFTYTAIVGQSMMKRRSLMCAGFFSGAVAFGSLVLIAKAFPAYSACRGSGAIVLWWATCLAMLYFYCVTLFADPGVFQSTSEGRREIYEAVAERGEVEITRQGFNVTTMVRKPLRSKHCSKTGQTVLRFDHYCVWTGNAIGAANHRTFVWYCISQLLCQLCVVHIVYYDALKCIPMQRSNPPSGFFQWVDFLFEDDMIIFTMYLVICNSMLLMFIVIVVITQLWYISRNITSNEVWFTERYKWMFSLAKRSFSLYDQGFWKNMKEFFWSGDLKAVSYTLPTMNAHLQKMTRKYAGLIRSQQMSAMANRGQNVHSHYPGQQGPPADAAAHDAGAVQPGVTENLPEKLQETIAQLPEEKRNEIVVVQGMLKALIAGEEPVPPPNLPPAEKERLMQQARAMHGQYMQAMAALRMHQGAVSQPTTTPPATQEATVAAGDGGASPLAGRKKED